MTEQKQYGADLVVDSLINHDVEYVFGIPGAKIDRVFDTLEDKWSWCVKLSNWACNSD